MGQTKNYVNCKIKFFEKNIFFNRCYNITNILYNKLEAKITKVSTETNLYLLKAHNQVITEGVSCEFYILHKKISMI